MRVAGFAAVNLVGALLVTGTGLAIAAGALTYKIGALTRMGPGYFPLVIGLVLAAIGLGLVVESRRDEPQPVRFSLRPVLAIFGGILFWALTLEPFGLVPSTIGLVVLTSLAQPRPSARMIALTALFLVAVSVGVFLYLLRIPIPALRF